MLLRGFIVSCECILRWKAKLLPVIGDVIAQAAPLSWTPLWQELYPMNHTTGPPPWHPFFLQSRSHDQRAVIDWDDPGLTDQGHR
jgi:hypothetical protein